MSELKPAMRCGAKGYRRTIIIALQMLGCLFLFGSSTVSSAFSLNAFMIPAPGLQKLRPCGTNVDGLTFSSSTLYMAKTAKKKKSKKKASSGGSSSGLKGFGSVGTMKGAQVDLDRSKEARLFYDFMEAGNAGDNLKRCAIGSFPISDDFQLRGVAALKPVKKGDAIIRIPYELAINLGQEGADPSVPAVVFLKDYCETLSPADSDDNKEVSSKAAYYEMLPPFGGDDCLGSTDFFSDEALDALQAPLVAEETRKRRERTNARFQSEIANAENFPTWIDGAPVTEEHLAWAVWLITSRVLTVQGDAEEGKSYRLLIPFLDMCNHDRSSSHVLSGRAVPGGELKVVAGAPVKEGDPIDICYGGGMAGNDRFLQGMCQYQVTPYHRCKRITDLGH